MSDHEYEGKVAGQEGGAQGGATGQGAGPQAQPQDAGQAGGAPQGACQSQAEAGQGGQYQAQGPAGYEQYGPQAGGDCGCGDAGGAQGYPQMGYPYGPQGGPQMGQPAGYYGGPQMGYPGGPAMGPPPGAQGGPPPMGHPGGQGGPQMGYPGAQGGCGGEDQPTGHSAPGGTAQPHVCNHGNMSYGPAPGMGMPGPMPGFHPGMPYGGHPGFAGAHSPMGQEAQFNQMMGMFGDIMNGKADMSKVTSWLGGVDSGFWKGALVGAALALLISSPMVSDTVKGMFSGLMGGGAQEQGEEA